MKLRDEDEYGRVSLRMPTVILAASAAIFVVLAIVLLVNNTGKNKKTHTNAAALPLQEEESEVAQPDTLTADDLNFWDMYQRDEDVTILNQAMNEDQNRKDKLEQREADMRQAELDAAEAAAKEAEENADLATDGKHTLVKHMDGSTEWLMINTSQKLNSYEDVNFQSKNGIVGYYASGRLTSRTGADISQYTTAIDWTRLKTEADYVMIRAGARGYDSGKILADSKFIENVKGAVNAGMPFGVYFSSQAISEGEAIEEATYVMTQLAYAQMAIENPGQELPAQATPVLTDNGESSASGSGSGFAANGTNLGTGIDPSRFNTTTTTKDSNGNTTVLVIDDKGNTTTTVTDSNGTVTSKTTVNTDPYGNVTTVKTDENGNQSVDTVNVSEVSQTNAANAANASNAATGAGTNPAAGTAQGAGSDPSAPTGNANGTGTTVVTGTTGKFRVTYPVAIEMHQIPNAASRIDSLSNSARTQVLNAFCSAVEKGGYNSLISGNKEFLLTRINLSAIGDNEVWVNNEGNLPDYPYMMNMWKYNTGNTLLKSLTGEYGVSLSFVDYSVR